MRIDETLITKSIIRESLSLLEDIAEVDVVIVGAGPSGLTAAYFLAKAGFKTLVFERRLSFGGGIGGGGMLLPRIVVEEPAHEILLEMGCKLKELGGGLYVMDASQLIAKLANAALDAGARILLGVTVEDLVYRKEDDRFRVTGVVAQWTAVSLSGLHVDPLSFKAKAVVDCTGHEAEVIRVAAKKIPELGIKLPGERSMWASRGEEEVVKYTDRICPGLYAAGMAVAALYGLPRMGPIFGGMLLSGKRIAGVIIEDLKRSS
ncbi:MAG: thiazole biosynthesis protein [Thermoprotei archaeon]|nr:thiazole biosynthesis protein [Thermoprotei archaeon]